jgi:hypothetical protein
MPSVVYVPVRKITTRPGCYFNKFGYVLVRTKPGCFELEHRMVVEKAIGRKLRPDEEVNHINGLKYDNRNSNLFVCNREYHTAWHQRCLRRFGTWHPTRFSGVRNPEVLNRLEFSKAVPLNDSEQQGLDKERRMQEHTRHVRDARLEIPRESLLSIFRESIGLVCDA